MRKIQSFLPARPGAGTGKNGAIQGEGNVNVSMDSDSRWVLSGDSSVTSLDGDLSGLDLNGHQLYINGVLYGE